MDAMDADERRFENILDKTSEYQQDVNRTAKIYRKEKGPLRMKIRPYRPNDEKIVIRLWIDCGLVVPHNNPIRDIERKLKVNPEWFLVGELDGKVIEFYKSIGFKIDDVISMGKRLEPDEPYNIESCASTEADESRP